MEIDTQQQLKDAFVSLPKVLQDAITNADVQANLRRLADVHKLHLDKWAILENEIMMALLGITDPNDLAHNIQEHVGLPIGQSQEIADSVVDIVFTPIQEGLKQEIGESMSTLEDIDAEDGGVTQKPQIDISKFSQAPTNATEYEPKTVKKYLDDNDPYHEAIE